MSQALRRPRIEPAPLRIRAASVIAAESAGTKEFKPWYMVNTKMKKNIVSKYLKKFGLNKCKQVVYIMRTSEDEYPKNKYPNWEDYIKASQSCGPWFICNDTIEELQYQLDHYKC